MSNYIKMIAKKGYGLIAGNHGVSVMVATKADCEQLIKEEGAKGIKAKLPTGFIFSDDFADVEELESAIAQAIIAASPKNWPEKQAY